MRELKIEDRDIVNVLGWLFSLTYLQELAMKEAIDLKRLIKRLRNKTLRSKIAQIEFKEFKEPFKKGVIEIKFVN